MKEKKLSKFNYVLGLLFVCFVFFINVFSTTFSFAESPLWIENQYFTIGSDEYKEVNPDLPSVAQAKLINSRHQVIVGMLDSGVDFTHPKLIKNRCV